MKDKLLEIIKHYGLENQRFKLAEEYQELQDELYNYIFLDEGQNILTEVADVIILCLQFMYEYGYDEEDLIKEMNFKIDRQLGRINNENIKQ